MYWDFYNNYKIIYGICHASERLFENKKSLVSKISLACETVTKGTNKKCRTFSRVGDEISCKFTETKIIKKGLDWPL